MSDFVHCHLHTHYSLLDGLSSPAELIEKAHSFGQPAISMTDHGNMHGAIEFYKKCKDIGIKPIIGMEAYIAPKSRLDKKAKKGEITAHHITLLAMNNEGYKNLMTLSTLGYTEGFYYKPRIDHEILFKYNAGIICLSGCLAGVLAKHSKTNNTPYAIDYIGKMAAIFGDRFYLEAMHHNIHEQLLLNDNLRGYNKRRGVPIVATNDVHYTYKEDAFPHETLLCIGTASLLSNEKRFKFPTQEFWLKDHVDMVKLLPKEWVERSCEIAERCDVDIQLGRPHLVRGHAGGFSQLETMCKTLIHGYPTEYERRMEYELKAIKRTGYGEYLLVVADFIKFAKAQGIPIGSGRGSSAGSLVCFLLGITNIDPIKYGLLFERFINPERNEPPDIDVDVCQRRRGEIIDYLRHEYGSANVAQIVTFGTLKTKAVFRDVGRAFGLTFPTVNAICKVLGDHYDGNVTQALLRPEVRKYLDKINLDKFAHACRRIEGKMRHSSTHAAGVVISSTALIDLTPLWKKPSSDDLITQYDMHGIEALGLLKFDVLGLRTLTVIHRVCKHLGMDPNDIPLEDSYTYKQLRRGETFGVFQYEGWGYTKFIKRMRPQNFEHIIALGALFRPGTLDSGTADQYLERMHGGGWQSNDDFLQETYGIMLYQEQVMQKVVKYAGFTMPQADRLRKAISKKDSTIMNEMLKQMHGVSQSFKDDIITFAKYGWNKAHAVSYALLSYQSAYLKYNHPTPFFCELLNSELKDSKRLVRIYGEAKRYDIPIRGADVNISDVEFKIHDGEVYAGLQSIKGVGEGASFAIVAERRQGVFADAEEFRSRVPKKAVNKTVFESLINAKAI